MKPVRKLLLATLLLLSSVATHSEEPMVLLIIRGAGAATHGEELLGHLIQALESEGVGIANTIVDAHLSDLDASAFASSSGAHVAMDNQVSWGDGLTIATTGFIVSSMEEFFRSSTDAISDRGMSRLASVLAGHIAAKVDEELQVLAASTRQPDEPVSRDEDLIEVAAAKQSQSPPQPDLPEAETQDEVEKAVVPPEATEIAAVPPATEIDPSARTAANPGSEAVTGVVSETQAAEATTSTDPDSPAAADPTPEPDIDDGGTTPGRDTERIAPETPAAEPDHRSPPAGVQEVSLPVRDQPISETAEMAGTALLLGGGESLGLNVAENGELWIGSITSVEFGVESRVARLGTASLFVVPTLGYRYEYLAPDQLLYPAGSRIVVHTLVSGVCARVRGVSGLSATLGVQLQYPMAGTFVLPTGSVSFGQEQRGVIPYLYMDVGYLAAEGLRWSLPLVLRTTVGVGVPGTVPMEVGIGASIRYGPLTRR